MVQETARADLRSNALAAALFAAIATDASLLAPVREAMAERFQRLEGFERLAIVNLAADALMFFDCLGISVGSPEGRQRILAALEGMILAPDE